MLLVVQVQNVVSGMGLWHTILVSILVTIEFLLIRTPPFPAKDANFRTLIHSYT